MHPGGRVAEPDAVGPPREPFTGACDEAGRDVETVRLHVDAALAAPGAHRLHEQSVGASDVEERAAGVDSVGDRLATGAPLLGRAAEAGSALHGRGAQVRTRSRRRLCSACRVSASIDWYERVAASTISAISVAPPARRRRATSPGAPISSGTSAWGRFPR